MYRSCLWLHYVTAHVTLHFTIQGNSGALAYVQSSVEEGMPYAIPDHLTNYLNYVALVFSSGFMPAQSSQNFCARLLSVNIYLFVVHTLFVQVNNCLAFC